MLRGGKLRACVLVCSPLSRFSPEPSASIPFLTHTHAYLNKSWAFGRPYMFDNIDDGTLEGYTFIQPTIHMDWNHIVGISVTRIYSRKFSFRNQKFNEKLRWCSFEVKRYIVSSLTRVCQFRRNASGKYSETKPHNSEQIGRMRIH